MEKGFPVARGLLVLAAAAVIAGCGGSPASRFYTLTPLPSPQASAPGAAGSQLAVTVLPVEIPEYLDRPQIVTRQAGNEVKVAEFDRWAGSLSENISDVLAEDLGQILGSNRVMVNSGTAAGKPDYIVAARLIRLDCQPGNQVLLKSQWRVASGDGKTSTTRISTITEKVSDKSYDAMVAAVNRAVNELSRQIAAGIPARPATATGGAATP